MLRQSKSVLSAALISLFLLPGCIATNKKSSQGGFAQRGNSPQVKAQIKSAVSKEKNLLEELTGKKVAPQVTRAQLRNSPLSYQHLHAGQTAAQNKNYIIAIKHFNTVIQNYPKSAQVKPALLAKSQVYREMGLTEPAQHNLRMAQRKVKPSSKKQIVKNQDSQKVSR